MSFLLPCPNCGERSVYEFRFGGEIKQRPALDAPAEEWADYRFNRVNAAGVQTEWWFHSSGCRQWLQAVRNTVSNEVLQTYLPGEDRP
ncbi:MAG: sarcosine oxidase subunit delta [Bryobacteraceae bacterium]